MSNIIEDITKDLKAIPKNLKAKAGGMDTKKLVLLNLPYTLLDIFVIRLHGCGEYQKVQMLLIR